VRGQVAAAT